MSRQYRPVHLFISIVLFVFLSSVSIAKNAFASDIERYDFGNMASRVTKHWEPDVALYVAKKFVFSQGSNAQVSVSKLNAGASNHFIYLVSVDNQVKFVIKGLSSKEEAETLLRLQNHQPIQNAQNQPGAAKICLSPQINAYAASNDPTMYYFAILEAAQGKELFKLMKSELIAKQHTDNLNDIFYNAGQQISVLHKGIVGDNQFISPKNLVTVIHDDLHPENAFYNAENKVFSLIDNESVGKSIVKPLPIARELYGLYEIPIIRWPAEKVTVDLLKDADPHEIASIYIELTNGLASVYRDTQEAKLYFTNTMIRLNDKAIAFLKNPYSEDWMLHPTDKSEQHIVWGKLSRALYDSPLKDTYISKLTQINEDLKYSIGSL